MSCMVWYIYMSWQQPYKTNHMRLTSYQQFLPQPVFFCVCCQPTAHHSRLCCTAPLPRTTMVMERLRFDVPIRKGMKTMVSDCWVEFEATCFIISYHKIIEANLEVKLPTSDQRCRSAGQSFSSQQREKQLRGQTKKDPCEMSGKSRSTVFFPGFVAPESRKAGECE